MADAAARLYGPTQLGSSAATIYTSAGSTTTIIRHILACNTHATAGTSATLTMSVGADAVGTRFLNGLTIPHKTTWEWRGFLVLAAAELIQAYSDTASAITLTVNGVKIT